MTKKDKERLRMKRMAVEEIKDFSEILKKRVVIFNNHHYIRVKWVKTYIDFEKQKSYQIGRKEVIEEIIAKIEKTKDENMAFLYKEVNDDIVDWTIPKSEIIEILKKLK